MKPALALLTLLLTSGCAVVQTSPSKHVVVPWFMAGPTGEKGLDEQALKEMRR